MKKLKKMEFKKINVRKSTVKIEKFNGEKFECKVNSNSEAFNYAENLKYLPEIHVHTKQRGDGKVWKQI